MRFFKVALISLAVAFGSLSTLAFADGGVSDGAAPPSAAAAPYPFIMCDQTARLTGLAANAILIAHVAGKTTYVCGWNFNLGLTVSGSAQLVWGTGTTCGSATASSSAPLINGATAPNGVLINSYGGAIGAVDQSPVSGTSDFCLNVANAPNVSGSVRYAQF